MTGKPLDITFIPGVTPTAVHTPDTSPSPLEEASETRLGQRCCTGYNRTGTDRHANQPGAQGWWSHRKRMAPPDARWTCKNWMLLPVRETHHQPRPHLIKPLLYRPTPGKQFWMHGMGITAYRFPQLHGTPRHSITKWGRYRYCRAPQGFHGSGDGYTRRFDDITLDMVCKTRCIDDSLLWDGSMGGRSAFWHTVDYISHCTDNGIVFNPDKFHFAEMQVEFAGFLITTNGVKPTKRIGWLKPSFTFPHPNKHHGH